MRYLLVNIPAIIYFAAGAYLAYIGKGPDVWGWFLFAGCVVHCTISDSKKD